MSFSFRFFFSFRANFTFQVSLTAPSKEGEEWDEEGGEERGQEIA